MPNLESSIARTDLRQLVALDVFEHLTDVAMVFSADGKIVEINPAAARLFDCRLNYSLPSLLNHVHDSQPDSNLNQRLFQKIVPALAQIQITLQHSAHWTGELAIHACDGRVYQINAIAKCLRCAKSELNWVDGSDEDSEVFTLITGRPFIDRRWGDSSAVDSELRFQRMADAAPIMIWQAGADGCCNFFNRPWLDFTGRTLVQELGDGWIEAVHPDDQANCLATWWRAFEQRLPFQMDYRLRRHDQLYRWMIDSATPRYSADGLFEGYVGSCIDITERKQLEEKICIYSEEMALANRRKDEFLSLLSHELRNPLVPIVNSLAIMQAIDLHDTRLIHSRSVIARQVANLQKIVNDLVDAAGLASGNFSLQNETVTLDRIVDCALEAAHPIIAAVGHLVRIERSALPVYVNGDPLRLGQAVSNLLQNAAGFTPSSGNVSITSGCRGERAFIEVKDDGLGFSAEFHPRLFELFAQADDSLARNKMGLGIGLGVAQRIVQLHGGSIEAVSAGLDQGSTFTIYLPAVAPASTVKENRPMSVDAPPSSQNFRVLLIDDNEDANGSMAALLELFQYQVRTAHDADSALQSCAEFKPHLILSDIGLPGMDGYQLAPALRQLAGERKLVIAAATGYGHASDRARSEAAGFDHHLVKPIDADTLLQFVAQQAAACTDCAD